MTDHTRQVLEPLSQATKTLLKPLRVRDTDQLFLWLDKGGERFLADLRCMVPRNSPAGLEESTWPGISHAAMSFYERIPEHKASYVTPPWEYRNQYSLAGTDFTALVISHCWPESQIHFRRPGQEPPPSPGEWRYPPDEGARLLYKYLLDRFFSQTRRAETIAEYKANKTVPPVPADWLEVPEMPLADYQRLIAMLHIGHESLAVFADMGTGKTAATIQAICHRARIHQKAGKPMMRVLIVCPPQVRTNWKIEFERFATIPGKVQIISGTLIQRVAALTKVITREEDCAFCAAIISYDSLVNTIDQFVKVPWDEAVCDESHKFKSNKTERWKSVEKIRDMSKFKTALTGSPIGNDPFDLWTQLEFLGKGLSGFESFGGFRRFFGRWKQVSPNARGIEKLIAMQNVPLLQERLARVSFQITKKEAGLQLPDKVHDYYEVEMTAPQRDFYKRVQNEIEVALEDKITGEISKVQIQTVLTQLLRLAQVTSGHMTWDPVLDPSTGDVIREKRVESITKHNPKINAVLDMLQDPDRDPNGKTIIWSCFRWDIQEQSRVLTEHGIKHGTYYGDTPMNKRDEIVREYNNNPECRVMLANPQSAGEGLNLLGYDWDNPDESTRQPTNTDHEIWFSCGWSSLDRMQASSRSHRRGTRVRVRETDLIATNSIDPEIRERVQKKQELSKMILDIQEILKSVLGHHIGITP